MGEIIRTLRGGPVETSVKMSAKVLNAKGVVSNECCHRRM